MARQGTSTAPLDTQPVDGADVEPSTPQWQDRKRPSAAPLRIKWEISADMKPSVTQWQDSTKYFTDANHMGGHR
jgi:hypothetical protein